MNLDLTSYEDFSPSSSLASILFNVVLKNKDLLIFIFYIFKIFKFLKFLSFYILLNNSNKLLNKNET